MIFLCLFGLAFYLCRTKTYGILFLASILNVILYPFTLELTGVVEATLDLTIIVLLIQYADKHRAYQIGLLFIALINHIIFEILNNVNFYEGAIIAITIMQLMGVIYDRLSQRIWIFDLPSHLYLYPHNPASEENKGFKRKRK